jgi:hypothetical protein
MRIAFILFLIVAFGARGFAQQPAPSTAPSPATRGHAAQPAQVDGPPSPEQVLKLMELMRVRDELQLTLDTMKKQVKNGAVQTFGEKFPDPTPDQLKRVNLLVDDVFHELSLDDLIQDLVPVYQRHFTRSDVRALITFYSSPPGQKILREQSAMMQESMQVAGASQQRRMETLLAKLELRMQQLISQEEGKPTSDKK